MEIKEPLTALERIQSISSGLGIERWDGIPPVSKDYERAREAIVERISQLLSRLKGTSIG